MKLQIEIDMDNAAFENECWEASRILANYAQGIYEYASFGHDYSAVLRDVNGNKVGTVKTKGDYNE